MSKVYLSKINGKLEEKISELLRWIGWEDIIKPESRVFIKPNLTFPTYKPGVTTSPVFLENLVKVLKTRCSDITIGETDGGYYAWKVEEAFLNHNLYEIQKKYNVNLINLYDSQVEYIDLTVNSKPYKIPLPRFLLKNIDVFITVPVLKVHSMTKFSFGLKNQWGCILNPLRLRYHHIFKEAVLKINQVLNPKIMIADPFFVLTDSGPMNGRTVKLDTLIAADDIFAFEKAGCDILGIKEEEVDYLLYAKRITQKTQAKQIFFNLPAQSFYTHNYSLKLTLKDRAVRRAFNSSFLTYLLYYSKVGLLLHRFYYFLLGRNKKTKFNF